MYYSLTGKLIFNNTTFAAIDCGGVAYKCFISLNTMSDLPVRGETVTLYTHLNVREDALDLFGFSTVHEHDMFLTLTSVNGVGAKVALAILSEFTPDTLSFALISGDAKALTRASGVGPKLASRIILELKDKMGGITAVDTGSNLSDMPKNATNVSEAISALVTLGYSNSEAAAVVAKIDNTLPVEGIVKEALKKLF